jgi:hypothetical protein
MTDRSKRTAPGKAPGAVLRSGLAGWIGLAALALASPISAQEAPVTVVGYVVDDSTGDPLGGVLLVADDGTRAKADPDGSYLLRDLAPGLRDVLVVGRGCRLSSAAFEVGGASPVRVDLRLTFGPAAFGEDREVPPDGRGRVVTEQEIEEWGAATVTQVIQRVAPGMVQGGSGQPGDARSLIGRGGRTPADDKTPVVVVDGAVIPIENTAMLDEIPPRDVAWIQVIPGAIGGWEYGTQGTGGVIRIRTRSGVAVQQEDMDPEECIGGV